MWQNLKNYFHVRTYLQKHESRKVLKIGNANFLISRRFFSVYHSRYKLLLNTSPLGLYVTKFKLPSCPNIFWFIISGDLTQMKIPSEILPPLFELLSGNKGFESFSSVLQISRKWFNFQQKFAWFQTVEDANNWYFERKFSGPNFVWTLADIGNCIVFFSFNFAKLYHISVASVFCHVTFWRQKASRRIIRVTTLVASSFHESSKVLSLHNNVFN